MRKTTLAATAAVIALGMSACGDGGGETDDEGAQEAGQEGQAGQNGQGEGDGGTSGPFGPGCSDFPEEGPGSLDEMAEQPFATAIADSPVLGNLSEALEEAGLTNDMDTAEGITVFAPTDEAFGDHPDGQTEDLLEDPDGLAHVLNNHVVGEEVDPQELGDGMFDALNGGQVRVAETGGEYTVNDYAPVVCGNVQTSNATVYVVSMLLIPS